MADAEKKAVVEIIEIDAGILFPDYTGARTISRKYINFKDQGKKVGLKMSVPAPTDLNEWTKLIDMPVAELAKKLTKTLVHSETYFDTAKDGLSIGQAQKGKFVDNLASEIAKSMKWEPKQASKATILQEEKSLRDAKDAKIKEKLGLAADCTPEEYYEALAKAVE